MTSMITGISILLYSCHGHEFALRVRLQQRFASRGGSCCFLLRRYSPGRMPRQSIHLRQSGLSFSNLIQQARFEIACSLLEDPDLRLADIAFDIGYSDPAHFTGAFRCWAGVTPSAYRTTQGLSAA
jgi:AraC-like DNA-binding protein